jgi:3',5'-cyclic AMP phosphodiesterase CpdA
MKLTHRRIAGACFTALLLVAWSGGNQVTAQTGASTTPTRIVLGWAGDPATSQAVTWRTTAATPTPQAQVALAVAAPDFAKSATTVAAHSTPVDLYPSGTVYHHVARLEGLHPATRYLYRVGDGKTWSEWLAFVTASDRPAPFRFIYIGDAQNGLADVFPRTIRAAYAQAPDARLVVDAGDLLAEGYDDRLWDEWTRAFGFVAGSVPNLPVPGNHDEHRAPESSDAKKVLAVSSLWNAHFSLPTNGPADLGPLAGQFYFLDYQGVRFICLDVNPFANEDYVEAERARVQASVAAWLRLALASNPNRWTIVVQHQPLYDVSKDRDYPEMRAALGALYDEFHVDLVLQGHDHAYARSFKLNAGRRVGDNEPGTVYMLSVSGSKMYAVTERQEGRMAKIIEGIQLYQVVTVEEGRLSVESFGADGQRVDSFQIAKALRTR